MKTFFPILLQMKSLMIKLFASLYQTMQDKTQTKNLWQKKNKEVIIKHRVLHHQNFRL